MRAPWGQDRGPAPEGVKERYDVPRGAAPEAQSLQPTIKASFGDVRKHCASLTKQRVLQILRQEGFGCFCASLTLYSPYMNNVDVFGFGGRGDQCILMVPFKEKESPVSKNKIKIKKGRRKERKRNYSESLGVRASKKTQKHKNNNSPKNKKTGVFD